jgi:hypothetical protein
MDSHTLEGLTARLEAAELGLRKARQAMLLGSFVVLLVIGGAVWWWVGSPRVGTGAGTVEAQHFVVRDANGAARAALELTEDGATQLVFYQDPLPGEDWRLHAKTGPFRFGVRSVRDLSQLVLSDPSGAALQFTPAELSMGQTPTPGLVFTARPIPAIYLSDSTGHGQMLTAAALDDLLAKRAAVPARPPKHRRGR